MPPPEEPDAVDVVDLEPFLAEVRAGAARWRAERALPPGLFGRLGDTGFFAERWRDGRRPGVARAMALIDAVAPLDGGLALALSLHSEVFLATLATFPRNPMAAAVFEQGLRGRAVGAMAITEDHGGSDPGAIACSAKRSASGSWRLEGHKRYISNLENATHCLVLVQGEAGERRGPTVFVVDLGQAGVRRCDAYDKLGNDSVGAWRLELDLEIDDGARLGPVGGGLAVLLGALRYERMAVACAVLAGARHALALSVEFLRQRDHRAGRLYDISALSQRAARAWTELDASTALFERLIERDRRADAVDADFAAVKYHAATTAQHVTDEALQLMGGRGYTTAYPHERILRDIRLARIGAGTDEMMLEIVRRHIDVTDAGASAALSAHMAGDVPHGGPHA